MITRLFNRFALFLGPARLRSLFLVIATTGFLSLVLNAVQGDWVIPAQTLLLLAAVVGSVIIILGKMDTEDRGRWLGVMAPAIGAAILAVTVLPQYALPLMGAAAGWVVAGLLLFRSRGPMQYQQAVKHLRKNELDQAVKVMDILIKQEPRNPDHYRFRAELLRVWGKLDRARRDYQRVTTLDRKSAVGYNGLAEVYLQSGDYEQALEAAQTAARLAPEEWVAQYNLGMIEDRLERSEDAIEHLTKALALKVPDARHRLLMYLYLARANARLNNPAAAQEAVIQMRKQRSGLDEWRKILESEQADTLREVLGEDVALAGELSAGRLDVLALVQ